MTRIAAPAPVKSTRNFLEKSSTIPGLILAMAALTFPAYAESTYCVKDDVIGYWKQISVFVLDDKPVDWPIYLQKDVIWRFTEDNSFRTFSIDESKRDQITINDLKKYDTVPMTRSYIFSENGRFYLNANSSPEPRQFECLKANETSKDYKAGDLIIRDFQFGTSPYAYILLRKFQ